VSTAGGGEGGEAESIVASSKKKRVPWRGKLREKPYLRMVCISF
jgi:hypothetical protein